METHLLCERHCNSFIKLTEKRENPVIPASTLYLFLFFLRIMCVAYLTKYFLCLILKFSSALINFLSM